jgi:hypothetical protein
VELLLRRGVVFLEEADAQRKLARLFISQDACQQRLVVLAATTFNVKLGDALSHSTRHVVMQPTAATALKFAAEP